MSAAPPPSCEKCGAPTDLREALEKSFIEIRKDVFSGRDMVDLKDVQKFLTRAAEHRYRKEKEADREWID